MFKGLSKRSPVVLLVAMGVMGALAACDGEVDPPGSTTTGNQCADVAVDGFKELVVVDEGVLADARSKNATNGAWSFRFAIENMTPPGVDPSAFTLAWLRGWASSDMINGYSVKPPINEPDTRAEYMQSKVICPWLKLTPENGCDATCSACTSQKLDLAKAPFRLNAITNRMDLRFEVEGETSGEGRLLYFLTGVPDTQDAHAFQVDRVAPADDPGSQPVGFSVIFEYRLPDTKSTKEWAEAWHALGRETDFGEGYRAALEKVTNAFVQRGSNPGGVNGSALAQIRTNESALNWVWQLREFQLDGSTGQLLPTPVRNTPPVSLNDKSALISWVKDNKDKILAGRYELPNSLRSGSANFNFPARWSLTGVEEDVRKKFSSGTCNGCHAVEQPSIDVNLHVSPFRSGVAKLSRHLYDPSAKSDEMRVRTTSLQTALCDAR